MAKNKLSESLIRKLNIIFNKFTIAFSDPNMDACVFCLLLGTLFYAERTREEGFNEPSVKSVGSQFFFGKHSLVCFGLDALVRGQSEPVLSLRGVL